MNRIVFAVINDLVTDQRVHKMATTVNRNFGDVLVIGRKLKTSLPLKRDYRTSRMWLVFTKGPFFYAEFNIRLFFKLLFTRCDVLVSNDLDTLAPCFLVSKIRGKRLVYDTHEYFLGMPELEGRELVKKVWLVIEKAIFPHLTNIITVNQSIANLYAQQYGKKLAVVRNIAPRFTFTENKTREELGIDPDKKMLILQGAGINIHRGAEEMIEAMQFIDNAILYIIGSGDVFPLLPDLVKRYNVQGRVIFINRMPYAQLMQYTRCADLGLSLDKDTNINYRFSLPNKLFDYIQAETPVFASDLPEIARIVNTYQVGAIFSVHNPNAMANQISDIIFNDKLLETLKQNCKTAAKELCWEVEEEVVKKVYKRAIL